MEAFTQFMVDWGYWGLFIAAFLSGSIIPFASEVVLVILLRLGLDPLWCMIAATTGNTLGGMSCYWLGTLGRTEWITKLGVSDRQMARARKFMAGRGALMAFFAFVPTLGEALAILLGLMRSNPWITLCAMCAGKLARYLLVLAAFKGIISLI